MMPSTSGHSFSPVPLFTSTQQESVVAGVDDETALTNAGLLKRDRYIATNRFSVRRNQQAKFEKRWATRKSKLAVLDGFCFFQLMRRVKLKDNETTIYDEGDTDEDTFENYVSFTIWQKKSHFSAWRNGEAFKEAHGGTSIAAVSGRIECLYIFLYLFGSLSLFVSTAVSLWGPWSIVLLFSVGHLVRPFTMLFIRILNP
jgi:heme-degrading monooxygenase HmoA